MDEQSKVKVLANDLDSMLIRVEALPPHPKYSKAFELIAQAKLAVQDAATDRHQKELSERYDI